MISFTEQNKILKKHFDLTVTVPEKESQLANGAEGIYLVLSWNKIAPTYSEALLKVLAAIESTHPFYNWRKGEIDEKHLRRISNKAIPEIIHAQLGRKYKGRSVESVRKDAIPVGSEYLLGAYEVGIILLLTPDIILKSYNDLWIDCPADEYDYSDSDGRVGSAPYVYFHDGEVEFGTHFAGNVLEHFGSASGLVPQSKLDSLNLDTLEILTLDSAIKIVKEAGYQISKII